MDLLPAIEHLYAFAFDERERLPALEAVSEALNSSGAVLCCSDPQAGQILSAEITAKLPARLATDFLAYYAQKEVRLGPALRHPVGQVMVDSDLIGVSEMRRTEIHNDLLVPNNVPHMSALWLRKSPQQYVSVSFQYDALHGAVRKEERERLARLSPHLVRAFQAHHLLKGATQAHELLLQLLETLPYGVCLLDASGHLALATSLAERELRRGFPLTYYHGRPHATDFESDGTLQRAIEDCLSRSGERQPGATVSLGRASQAPTPLTVLVLPLGRSQLQAQFRCLLLLLDPEARVQARATHIQQTLQLTHAEALLAMALMEGVTLQEAARRLNRSYNTCKTQMKSIYGKTGCCTQSELVRKLLVLAMGHSLAIR